MTNVIKAASIDQYASIKLWTTADGLPKTDATHSTSGLSIKYQIGNAAVQSVTVGGSPAPASMSAGGAHADWGIYHRGNGWYVIGLADAVLATAGNSVTVWIELTDCDSAPAEIYVSAYDGALDALGANKVAPATPENVTSAQTAITNAIGALTIPSAANNATAVRTELAVELGRIDEKVSADKSLTAATLATLFDDSDASQQLTDFFAGLIDRFDEDDDTPVATIAAAMIAALVSNAGWIELLADAEAARAAAVANGIAIGALPAPLNSVQTGSAVETAINGMDVFVELTEDGRRDLVALIEDDAQMLKSVLDGVGDANTHLDDIKGTGFVKDTHSLPQCLTGSGGAGGDCDSAEIAGLVLAGLGSLSVELLTPYNEKSKTLNLVQRADYKSTSLIGPLRIKIESASVSAGEVVRFGAVLEGETAIEATGIVVELDSEFYAEIELTKESHTNRQASLHWRWELQHENGSGDVSPLWPDEAMTLLPSHADE
jgi:hypothetical protein